MAIKDGEEEETDVNITTEASAPAPPSHVGLTSQQILGCAATQAHMHQAPLIIHH